MSDSTRDARACAREGLTLSLLMPRDPTALMGVLLAWGEEYHETIVQCVDHNMRLPDDGSLLENGAPWADDGEVLVLRTHDQQVIGITGWWTISEEVADADKVVRVGLRWHGIDPIHQGQGLGKIMLDMLCQRLRLYWPAPTPLFLYEATLTDAPIPWFRSCGFALMPRDQQLHRQVVWSAGGDLEHSTVMELRI